MEIDELRIKYKYDKVVSHIKELISGEDDLIYIDCLMYTVLALSDVRDTFPQQDLRDLASIYIDRLVSTEMMRLQCRAVSANFQDFELFYNEINDLDI